MSIQLSESIKQLQPSLTLSIGAKAKTLRKEGIKVFDLAAGEPDFDTPQYIKEAAMNALTDGFTKYTPTSGIDELKERIIEKLKYENNLEYDKSQIVIGIGAKQCIFNAILTLCSKGDEVIIISPYWVSYPEMVKAAAAKPVYLTTTVEDEFEIDIDKLQKLVNKNTKLLIINSPANPTGKVYSPDTLMEIAKIVVENDLFVLSDEIYEKLIYDDKTHISIAALSNEIKNRTIVVNGFSKTYSMTGWRIGYLAAADKTIIDYVTRLQDHSTSGCTSFVQKGAIAALTKEEEVKKMLKEFNERRNVAIEELSNIRNIKFYKPAGAFYIFPDVSYYYKEKLNNSIKLCEYLLDSVKVATVPGVAFGDDNCIRISYATNINDVKEGIRRIKEALNKI